MKKTVTRGLGLVFVFMLFAYPAFCAEEPAGSMEKANELVETREMESIQQAIGIYETILEKEPDNFTALWQYARACPEYAVQAQHQGVDGWKDICAEYGKKGMQYAQKAMELKPEKVQGYYFYGLSVGVYSDGVGLITALKEGLKDKTQNNLERAYEIDKTFNHGGPILALGRFWQKVPWPYHDEDKALKFYRELQNTPHFGKETQSYIWLAEILADKWGKEPKKEARQLLEKAVAQATDPYWKEKAEEQLEDL